MRTLSLVLAVSLVAVFVTPETAAPDAETRPQTRFQNLVLRDGQIIVTESGGPASMLMSLVPDSFYPFSHIGIIAVEQGEAVVYEARGTYKATPGTPADDWFLDTNGIRRLTVEQHLENEEYAAVYEPPPGTNASDVVAFVRRHYEAQTPFDPYFDHDTADRLYCAELVHDALVAGGWRGIEPVPIQANASLRAVLSWWGFRMQEILPVGRLLPELRYHGELGDDAARADAALFNAVKKEIYRRFTPDQKLGNVFAFSRELTFRTPIRRLLSRARETIDYSSADTGARSWDARIRALADELFGTLTRVRSSE